MLIGPDSPIPNSNAQMGAKTIAYCAEEFLSMKQSLPLHNPTDNSKERMSTDTFVESYLTSNNSQGVIVNSEQEIQRLKETVRQQSLDIEELRTLVRTLFLKSINSIKNSRQAIGVILDFYNTVNTVQPEEARLFLDHIKQSMETKKDHFTGQLDTLKRDIEEIGSFNLSLSHVK